MNGIYSFYKELDMSLFVRIYHHHGLCWQWTKKMGYMGRRMWNFFHVLCNVSYFAHVNLMEDFLQNSPSMIHSSIYMSFIDTLVYGELPSPHDLVVHVQVFLCLLVLGRADIISSMFWTTTQGWVTLGIYPHQY